MAQVTRAASKLKFETGDIPTQADFEDLHDSVKWYDEGGGGGTSSTILLYQALGSTLKAASTELTRLTVHSSLSNAFCRGAAVYLEAAATITGVKWLQGAQGNYTGSNYNGVGLYTYAAGVLTLVASSTNDADMWKGSAFSLNAKAFSSTYSAAAGLYFVVIYYNNSAQTTAPAVGLTQATATSNALNGDFTNSATLSFTLNAFTLESSITLSGVSGQNTIPFLALY